MTAIEQPIVIKYSEVLKKLNCEVSNYNDQARLKGKDTLKSQHIALLEDIIQYYIHLYNRNDNRAKGHSKPFDGVIYKQLNFSPKVFLKDLCKKRKGRSIAPGDYTRMNRHYERLEETNFIKRSKNENNHVAIFINSSLF